jgi:para-aminobenzoate synthetase component I
MPAQLQPIDLARILEPKGGLAFFDSALSQHDSHSLVAAAPELVLRGHLLQDITPLEDHLIRHQGQPGALMGYVTYDGHYCFGHYPTVHRYSHAEKSWLADNDLPATHTAVINTPRPPQLNFRPLVNKTNYLCAVEQAKRYIEAGDIYQVNLTYPWTSRWPTGASPFSLYQKLRSISPAPQACYLDLGGLRVLSSSPECFLHMEGVAITTHPIKGTRPRGSTTEEDQHYATTLISSQKERAELLMITDLLRNDLGQICEFGSIKVPSLWDLQSYAHVHHLVSTVSGTLRTGISQASALRACFPGGSITGAPKLRAMQIISELEPHKRGLYTGAIGYLDFQGQSQFSICIRTLTLQEDIATFSVGSGIVSDSIPSQEYEETLHKAEGLLRACKNS